MISEPLLTEKQLAQRINISLPSIRRWRSSRTGPRFLRLGSSVRYDPRDLAVWLERQKEVVCDDGYIQN